MDGTKRIALLLVTRDLIRAVVRARLKFRSAEREPGVREGPRVSDGLRREAGRDELPVFPLETERLIIRPFVPEDAGEIHGIYADPGLMHRITGRPSKSLEDTRRLLARLIEHQREYGFSLWAMIEKESGRIIGDCGLFLVQGCWPEVEFTYRLGRPCWCKGYAKEAAVECLRFGFEQLDLERIVAVLAPDDPISARMLGVMEKAGMCYMGTGWFHEQEMFVYAASKKAGAS